MTKCLYININMTFSYYRTIFTKIPRYNYLDPDFAYTDIEKFIKKANEYYYTNYIRDRRSLRLKKQAER